MVLGNMPNDWGYLHFTLEEKERLTHEYPITKNWLKKVIGSQEFIKGIDRYCLWIQDSELDAAYSIPILKDRLEKVFYERSRSKKISYNKFASKPHKFVEIRHKDTAALIVPGISSEKREYILVGSVDKGVIINNLAFAIYDPEPHLFGILSSKMHMTWVRAIGGQLETRIRYSSVLCYNTFPFPEINEKQKQSIASHVYNILEEREKHPEKTMADLYDPNKMPAGLKKAHQDLDIAIELCYRSKPFTSDEERLEHLFKLYEGMVNEK